MPSEQTRIAAPADEVWAMVSDITRMGEWSPENLGGDWVPPATGPEVGAKFKGRNKRGKAKWSTTCEVTVADPGREFTFAVGGAEKAQTTWSYKIEPDGDGCVVTESYVENKPMGAAMKFLTWVTTGVKDREADLAEGMRTTLAGLKDVAETG